MKKKVLLIGPDFYNYNQSVEKAFEHFGYYIETLSYIEYLEKKKDRFKYYILPKFGISIFKSKYVEEFNKNVVKRYKEMKPDIVVVIKGNIITSKTLREMSDSVKILWMMDSIFSVENSISLINEYDYSFMFEETDIEYLNKEGIETLFLPVGYDDSVYYNTGVKIKDIDIVFVGSLYGGRKDFFEGLVKRFSGLNIKIYGKYLDIKKPNTFYKYYFKGYNKYFMNRNILPKETNEVYNQSKIAINLHHAQSIKSCNPRFFEILASGTFQLVDNKPYIREQFTKNYDIVTFESYAELENHIVKYLEDTEEREKIAIRGKEKVSYEHSFKRRIESMLYQVDYHEQSKKGEQK